MNVDMVDVVEQLMPAGRLSGHDLMVLTENSATDVPSNTALAAAVEWRRNYGVSSDYAVSTIVKC